MAMRTIERELMIIRLSRLWFHLIKVDRTAINAHRCTCLHAISTNTMTRNALCKVVNSRFCTSSTLHLSLTDVHQSVKESSCCDNHCTCVDVNTPYCLDTQYLTILYQQLVGLILKDVEVVRMVEYCAPFPDKFTTITLRSWTPNGRSFRSVR